MTPTAFFMSVTGRVTAHIVQAVGGWLVRKHRLHCRHIWVPKRRHNWHSPDPEEVRCVKCGEE